MTLKEIGLKHGSDKATTHFYMDNYAAHFEPLRDKELVVWEIGVASGASLKMWREYFRNSMVIGIDNNPDCAGEGVFIGSQVDFDFMNKVWHKAGPPDIIIDDGSHYGPYTIQTFEWGFPIMSKGGIYVVEDTHCFYDVTYGCAPEIGEDMSEVFKFFSGLASHVDVQGRGMTGNTEYALRVEGKNWAPVPKYSYNLASMHIYPSLWLFKRKP